MQSRGPLSSQGGWQEKRSYADGEPDESERETEIEARAFSSGLHQQSEPGPNVS